MNGIIGVYEEVSCIYLFVHALLFPVIGSIYLLVKTLVFSLDNTLSIVYLVV